MAGVYEGLEAAVLQLSDLIFQLSNWSSIKIRFRRTCIAHWAILILSTSLSSCLVVSRKFYFCSSCICKYTMNPGVLDDMWSVWVLSWRMIRPYWSEMIVFSLLPAFPWYGIYLPCGTSTYFSCILASLSFRTHYVKSYVRLTWPKTNGVINMRWRRRNCFRFQILFLLRHQ